jgi:hypothetical protein
LGEATKKIPALGDGGEETFMNTGQIVAIWYGCMVASVGMVSIHLSTKGGSVICVLLAAGMPTALAVYSFDGHPRVNRLVSTFFVLVGVAALSGLGALHWYATSHVEADHKDAELWRMVEVALHDLPLVTRNRVIDALDDKATLEAKFGEKPAASPGD